MILLGIATETSMMTTKSTLLWHFGGAPKPFLVATIRVVQELKPIVRLILPCE